MLKNLQVFIACKSGPKLLILRTKIVLDAALDL